MGSGRSLLGLLWLLAGCQATDLRGHAPPCLDGWRACRGECVPDDECRPIVNTASSSAYHPTCDPTTFDLTVPDAEASAVLVWVCRRHLNGDERPAPKVSYRGLELKELGSTESLNASEDVSGAPAALNYRSALYWSTAFAGGEGMISTTNADGECWFTAMAYSGVSADRPAFYGAVTEQALASISIDSEPDQLAIAHVCMKTFDTTDTTLKDVFGQTRRTFDDDPSDFMISATADRAGAAPTIALGWDDLSGIMPTVRRTAMGGVSLQPVCPTCVGVSAPTRRTTLASDDFNRADGALGDAWLVYPPRSTLAIVAGRLRTSESVPGEDALQTFGGGGPAPNDQWSSLVISTFGTGYLAPGPVVRWQNSPTLSGYACRAGRQGPDHTSFIHRFTDGVSAKILAGNDLVDWMPGDAIRCEAEGSMIRMFHIRGGVETLVVSAYDTRYSGGKPGILTYAGTPTEVEVDDFATGGFTSD
ncbi:MAG: hypothetical protein AB7O24_26470 [Kofleriaceae bacterium]